ncbi:hypothetical protein F0562_004623 [Nyssa sinensis]|uniref:Uncharacterized protein n=1 Tax=Nyssa sinensis TaxID=561372 RepID=A0A5J5BZQ7_9ASTE|nr:hypothetical protein F0562_004623 [Nyssa sinensis]
MSGAKSRKPSPRQHEGTNGGVSENRMVYWPLFREERRKSFSSLSNRVLFYPSTSPLLFQFDPLPSSRESTQSSVVHSPSAEVKQTWG